MASFKIVSRDNLHTITSLEDWQTWCRPRIDQHWRDGKSAKECASAWFRHSEPAVPAELSALFDLHPLTQGLVVREAMPELQTHLDNFGKGRCHDLVVRGQADARQVLIGIEAKVSESYGNHTGAVYDKSHLNARSKGWNRIDGLVQGLFGHPLDALTRTLRYQLLHGVAGTLIQATLERPYEANIAVFVVHEFVANGRIARTNNADLLAFITALTGTPATDIPDGPFLLGPFNVPGFGRIPAHIPLLIGKVSVSLVS